MITPHSLIDPEHPLKEFAEEIEPVERKCLCCGIIAPSGIRTIEMIGGKGSWYSPAMLNIHTGKVKRAYLCPDHLHAKAEAWRWLSG